MILAARKSNLRSLEPSLGAWLLLREPLVAEAAATAGYDYVCIDCQHGLPSYETLSGMLTAAALGMAFPIVRVPSNDPGFIGRVLDLGALGIIVPLVNTKADAEAAVDACRYPPDGHRSFGPASAMVRFGAEYPYEANTAIAVIVMVETMEGVANIEDIVGTEGVDAVYVGPSDLSCAMGLPPAMDHDESEFQEALASVAAACEAADVIPGVHCNSQLAGRRYEQGYRMLTVGFDLQPLVAGLRRARSDAEAAVRSPDARSPHAKAEPRTR